MKNKEKKKFIIGISITLFIIILLIFSVIFALLSMTNTNILEGITIEGIEVGNLSKEEAIQKLTEIANEKLEKDIELKYGEFETSMHPSQIEATIDIEKAVSQAFEIGRRGNILQNNYTILTLMLHGKEIPIEIQYDEPLLQTAINDLDGKLPGRMVESSYYIEDETLILLKGKEGIVLNKEQIKEDILQNLKKITTKQAIIEIPVENKKPSEINIEKIKNEIHKEPQDAYISKNPFEVHPHVNGVDLAISLEKAKELLQEEKEEYSIPLKITIPDKTTNDLGEEAFPHKLATYSTKYNINNPNRENNIQISVRKIDGTIILPGETFSYNKIVGERTISEGYKTAAIYAGGKVEEGIGGGICQTSSTLYNAVLLANLEIVERSNHYFPTSYVPAGRDATVSWGTIDFKFKNTRNYPVKIVATAVNGTVNISLLGIKEENEYEVLIQSKVVEEIPYTTQYEETSLLAVGEEHISQTGANGCKSETYKILKKDGEILSQTLLSKDTYNPLTQIIKKGTNKTTTETTAEDALVRSNENNAATNQTSE